MPQKHFIHTLWTLSPAQSDRQAPKEHGPLSSRSFQGWKAAGVCSFDSLLTSFAVILPINIVATHTRGCLPRAHRPRVPQARGASSLRPRKLPDLSVELFTAHAFPRINITTSPPVPHNPLAVASIRPSSPHWNH